MALADMFLKLDGVEGESKDTKCPGQIQVDDFHLGAVGPPRETYTDRGSPAVRLSHLTIKAKVDKSTAKLYTMCTMHATIPTAVLTCRKAGGEQAVYLLVTLTDVFVIRVEIGGEPESGGAIPQCEFDLEFGRIEMKNFEQTEKGISSGAIVFKWDLRLAKPV